MEVAEVVVEFTIVKLVMVEVALLTKSPPLKVARPETVRPVKVPTLVNDELTTAEPRAVAVRVETPSILRPRPEARLRSPLTYKLVVVALVLVLFTIVKLVMVEVEELIRIPSVAVRGVR